MSVLRQTPRLARFCASCAICDYYEIEACFSERVCQLLTCSCVGLVTPVRTPLWIGIWVEAGVSSLVQRFCISTDVSVVLFDMCDTGYTRSES